jgi:hypothetical protein
MPEWNFHVVDHESDNFLAAHCRQHYPVDFCANLRVGRDNGGVTKDSLIGNVEPHHVYEDSGDLSRGSVEAEQGCLLLTLESKNMCVHQGYRPFDTQTSELLASPVPVARKMCVVYALMP